MFPVMFFHEISVLRCCKWERCPLLILGEVKIHVDNSHSVDFLYLLNSFNLKRVGSPPTHKAGKDLDLILLRNCTTEKLMVTPLHDSDRWLIRFSVSPGTSLSSSPSCSFTLS